VKPLLDGFDELPFDAPLFDDGSGEPSPVGLDSLDTLDVVSTLGERFDLDTEKLDEFIWSDTEITAFRTINDIADFISSLMTREGAGPATMGLAGTVNGRAAQERG
jgi:acyl carrier protein